MSVKKILIADDHTLFRAGMESMLTFSFSNAQIIEAENGREAISQYKAHKPDVILMDYQMPEMNGLDASQQLLKTDKNIKIILFTMFDTGPVILNFLKMGGKGIISKNSDREDVIDGVRTVAQGDYYFSSTHKKEIVAWMAKGLGQKVPQIKFSPLELEIVAKVSQGKTSKEIGHDLKLSPRTVETYRYDLLRKTQVKNTTGLIEYFFRNGISLEPTSSFPE